MRHSLELSERGPSSKKVPTSDWPVGSVEDWLYFLTDTGGLS